MPAPVEDENRRVVPEAERREIQWKVHKRFYRRKRGGVLKLEN